MAYTVLARRYRSTTFDDVIGQDHVALTLKKAIDSGRIAHAYLFCGTRGVGKTSMARILAKALNCQSFDKPTSTPCGKCDSCLSIARGDDLDVIEIDAASNRGIDNIRDLISNAQYRPARARFKIYIIDEVHGLTKESFNALLKVLEEPPSHVKFILATTEPEKVLPTILSRCQRYDFRNIATREIAEHLKDICSQEKIKADDDALLLIAKAGAGSMRDALSLLDRMLSAGETHLNMELVERLLGLPRSQLIFDLTAAIGAGDVKSVLKQADAMINSGLSVDTLLATLVDHVRNLLIVRTCGVDSELVEVPGLTPADLAAQAEQFDAAALTQDITILEELRRQIRQSQAGRALLDATLVRLALSDQFSSIGDLLSQLQASPASEAQKKNGEPRPPVSRPVASRIASEALPAESSRLVDSPPPEKTTPSSGAERLPLSSGAPGDASSGRASGSQIEPASDSAGVNLEPIAAGDLPKVWTALLGALSSQGPALHSILNQGRLVRIDDGLATIRYGVQHETFVRMLDRNGKKDLVRDSLSRVLGKAVGVKFEVEAEEIATAPPQAPPAPAPPQNAARAGGATEALTAPASQPPPSARVTAEMVEEIRQSDPLVRTLMDTLGATIIKIE